MASSSFRSHRLSRVATRRAIHASSRSMMTFPAPVRTSCTRGCALARARSAMTASTTATALARGGVSGHERRRRLDARETSSQVPWVSPRPRKVPVVLALERGDAGGARPVAGDVSAVLASNEGAAGGAPGTMGSSSVSAPPASG